MERWIQELWTSMSLSRGGLVSLGYCNPLISIRTCRSLLSIPMMLKIITIQEERAMIPEEVTASHISQLLGKKARLPKIKGNK